MVWTGRYDILPGLYGPYQWGKERFLRGEWYDPGGRFGSGTMETRMRGPPSTHPGRITRDGVVSVPWIRNRVGLADRSNGGLAFTSACRCVFPGRAMERLRRR